MQQDTSFGQKKNAGIFDEGGSKSLLRVCRLFKGRQRLSRNRMLYACADRLSLVFIHKR